MSTQSPSSGLIAITAMVKVPQHVVYRPFAAETVVLNLDTGLYHSLNPTAGKMMEVLDRVGSVQQAVTELTAEYDKPGETIRRDVCSFSYDLVQAGLLEVVGHSS